MEIQNISLIGSLTENIENYQTCDSHLTALKSHVLLLQLLPLDVYLLIQYFYQFYLSLI